MRQRQAHHNLQQALRANAFVSEILEAARVYHMHLANGGAKAYMPVELSAFIAGARWARQMLVRRRRNKDD
jgi:hypothetical protein